jgi:hypothetical protein
MPLGIWLNAGGLRLSISRRAMRKKWSILILIVLLAGIAVGFWASLRPRRPVVVQGNLSPQDVANIKSVVSKDMSARIFPRFSLRSVGRLMANLKAYRNNDIMRILLVNPNPAIVLVDVGDFTKPEETRRNWEYALTRTNKGWAIQMIYSDLRPGELAWRAPPTNAIVMGTNAAAILGSSVLRGTDSFFSPRSIVADRKATEITLKPSAGTGVHIEYHGHVFAPGSSNGVSDLKSLMPVSGSER